MQFISLIFVLYALVQFYWNNVADAIFYMTVALYVQSLLKDRR